MEVNKSLINQKTHKNNNNNDSYQKLSNPDKSTIGTNLRTTPLTMTPPSTWRSLSSVGTRSSSSTSTSTGRYPPNGGKKATMTSSLSSSTPSSLSSSSPLFGAVTGKSTTASIGLEKQRGGRSVLRFGETVESLFGITKQSSLEHKRLAKGIADGSLADDPQAWRQVLQLASQETLTLTSTTNSTNHHGTTDATDSSIRLHRRATLRFPLPSDMNENDDDDPVKKENILQIWLSFAAIHVHFGMIDEARRTWRYIENQMIQLGASYYVQVAELEAKYDLPAAIQILQRGLNEKAEPVHEIQTVLEKMHTSSTNSYGQTGGDETRKRPPILDDSSSDLGSSPHKRSSNISLRDSTSKRHKKASDIVESASEVPNNGTPIHEEASAVPPANQSNKQLTKTNVAAVNPVRTSSLTTIVGTTKMTDVKPPAVRARPSRLLSSRLGSKGLSGRAKRVEAENSIVEESDSEQDSESEEGGETAKPAVSHSNTSSCNPPPPKLNKLDLGYMWDWDPNARSGKTQELKTETRKSPDQEKIEEATSSSGQGVTASTHRSMESTSTSTTSSVTSSRKSSHSVQNNNKDKDSIQEGTVASKLHGASPNDSSSKLQQATHPPKKEESTNAVATPNTRSVAVDQGDPVPQDDTLARVNREFLPLVHENNIVQVNGSSYAKLGVIGKGGSCKVYRALSKKCAVVAIKKVKLEGMDKKAIEGYANEISLLKRLRGNSTIIQMYDAEVDLQRKSIFVVMELGEADLSHILQQRALSTGQKNRSLNMNFIRLTWQQMLSAVHAIHEQRIIHSDLKPANFLFVRGALKLIDFGIAKAIQSDDTTNIYRESHIGTLNYMSPEAILDTETGTNGPRMRIGRVRSDCCFVSCVRR